MSGTNIDIDELVAQNERFQAELGAKLEKAELERKAYGETSEATAKAVKTAEKNIADLAEKVEQAEAKIRKVQMEIQRDFGGADEAKVKSPGQKFVESDAYKRMIDKDTKGSDPFRLKSLTDGLTDPGVREFKQFIEMMERKDATLTSGGNAAALVSLFATMRLGRIITTPWETFKLSQIIPVTPTTSDAIQWVKETQMNRLYTEVASQASSGQKDIVVDNAVGFKPGSKITLDPDGVGNGPEVATVDTVTLSTDTITVLANLANTHAVDTAVVSDEYNYTPETKLKPQSRFVFDDQTETIATIATWTPASRQVLADVGRLRNHIDGRLLASLASQKDKQILYGAGGSSELNGIFADASVQTYNWSQGTPGDTRIDALRRAKTLVQISHFDPDAYVMNPQDWEKIELAKGDDGHYIWITVMIGGQMRLFALPVVVTTACDAGDFGVGAWRMALELFDREQSSIRVSDQHEDYFTRNMVAILGEERNALCRYLPEAIVYGKFDNAPAA